jgi:hypothetical protein
MDHDSTAGPSSRNCRNCRSKRQVAAEARPSKRKRTRVEEDEDEEPSTRSPEMDDDSTTNGSEWRRADW